MNEVKWNRSEKIAFASLLVSIFGFLILLIQLNFATGQLEKNELNQRAQFLTMLQQQAFDSESHQDIFQKIEYGQIAYQSNDFHGSEDQKNLVSFLSFLEFIGQLENMGLIRFSDVNEVFGYFILRTYQSQTVSSYRKFLKNWASSGDFPDNVAFPKFENLAKRIEYKIKAS